MTCISTVDIYDKKSDPKRPHYWCRAGEELQIITKNPGAWQVVIAVENANGERFSIKWELIKLTENEKIQMPEKEQEQDSRPFCLYEINEIHHDNCMNLIDAFPDEYLDACITDFPYGIDFQSNMRIKSEKFDKIANDKEPYTEWIKPLFPKLKEGGRLICFYRWDVQDKLFKAIEEAGFILKSQLVWNKGAHGMGDLAGSFGERHELMIYATKGRYIFPDGKRPVGFYNVVGGAGNSNQLVHPNEKPINLMREIVRDATQKGELIFEPFSGSGSLPCAAKHEGRDFIASELDHKHVETGRRRLKSVNPNKLFG